jgi:hypothetical protein
VSRRGFAEQWFDRFLRLLPRRVSTAAGLNGQLASSSKSVASPIRRARSQTSEGDAVQNQKEAKPIRALVPAILWAAFHGLLWIVLLGMMLSTVPPFAKIFADFDVDLPVMTQCIVIGSSLCVRYWFVALPAIAVLCAADSIVLHALYLRPKAVALRWLWLGWLGLMLLVPLGLMVWTMLAMWVPFILLLQRLR